MSRWQLALALCLTLIAFAANSVLCRLALASGLIDAAAFTAVRICSGALMLLLIVRGSPLALRPVVWLPAAMLFAYAACFSFAYIELSAGTGALLLFGAVQVTMIAAGVGAGERPPLRTWLGWAVASGGLVYLVLPGIEAPPLTQGLLMLAAGVAWGIYSLLGKRELDPVGATARNFALAVPMGIALLFAMQKTVGATAWGGIGYAVLSGAITSALGYVLWYRCLRQISSVSAAIAQLSVPLIAALGGVLLLSETMTSRLAVSAALILGGIALGLKRK